MSVTKPPQKYNIDQLGMMAELNHLKLQEIEGKIDQLQRSKVTDDREMNDDINSLKTKIALIERDVNRIIWVVGVLFAAVVGQLIKMLIKG